MVSLSKLAVQNVIPVVAVNQPMDAIQVGSSKDLLKMVELHVIECFYLQILLTVSCQVLI